LAGPALSGSKAHPLARLHQAPLRAYLRWSDAFRVALKQGSRGAYADAANCSWVTSARRGSNPKEGLEPKDRQSRVCCSRPRAPSRCRTRPHCQRLSQAPLRASLNATDADRGVLARLGSPVQAKSPVQPVQLPSSFSPAAFSHLLHAPPPPHQITAQVKRHLVAQYAAIARAVLARGAGQIRRALRASAALRDGRRCFNLLRFDVLLDTALKAWLLEVNVLPNLCTAAPLEHAGEDGADPPPF
jgi:hypothetical protein